MKELLEDFQETNLTREEKIQSLSESFGRDIAVLLVEYEELFDNGFPTYPVRSDEWMIKVLKDCIKQNKSVYDLGHLTLDEDVLY